MIRPAPMDIRTVATRTWGTCWMLVVAMYNVARNYILGQG